MNIAKLDQWKEAFADQEFAVELLKMEKDAALKVLNEKGYDFTGEDMDEMLAAMKEYISKMNENGELSEDALEDVAGGGHLGSFFGGLFSGLGAAVIGFLYGIAHW